MSETHEHALVERALVALLALERQWSTRVLSLALDCLAADEGYCRRLVAARSELVARAANLAQIVGAEPVGGGAR